MTPIYPMENQEQMLDQKYFEEIEELHGREWPYTFMMLALSLRSLYIAARENGFNQSRAASSAPQSGFKTEDWLADRVYGKDVFRCGITCARQLHH